MITVTTGLVSCDQKDKSRSAVVSQELEKSMTVINVHSQPVAAIPNEKNVDTKFVYVDSNGKELIIENSYPRGGLKYTDPLGEDYVYAVFWTRITNKMNNPFEFKMDLYEDSYELSSSPGRIFKLFIPSDTLTPEKEQLFNYGLDLEKYLDENFRKQANLERTIAPKGSTGFYIVTLFNQGVNGTLRTGLKINNAKLLYKVNEMTIECGETNLKQLKLKE